MTPQSRTPRTAASPFLRAVAPLSPRPAPKRERRDGLGPRPANAPSIEGARRYRAARTPRAKR